MGVTRIFEKIEEGIKNQQAEISGAKKMVLDWAQRQALHHHNQEMSGQPHFSLGYKLAQKMVFKKVILNIDIQGVPKKSVICGKWSLRATGLS